MLEKEGTVATNNSENVNDTEISCPGTNAWDYFETFVLNAKQFLN